MKLLVTGGSRGIGRATVLRGAALGHEVVFVARDAEAIRSTEEESKRLGHQVMGMRCDVSLAESISEVCECAATRMGGLDGVIANAAVSLGGLLPLTDDSDIEATLWTNFEGVLNTVRAAAGIMKRTGGGSIVCLGSLAANGAPSNSVYSASKAALVPLVARADQELMPFGIRCHLLVPGLVETSLVEQLPQRIRERLIDCAPLRRSASVDEIASLAVALATGQGRALAGRPLNATGGLQEIPG